LHLRDRENYDHSCPTVESDSHAVMQGRKELLRVTSATTHVVGPTPQNDAVKTHAVVLCVQCAVQSDWVVEKTVTPVAGVEEGTAVSELRRWRKERGRGEGEGGQRKRVRWERREW
jgi:hypothetical protein